MGGVVAAAEAVDVERGDLLAGLPRVPAVAYDDCAPGAVDAQRPRCDDVEGDDARGSDVALARSIDDAAAAGGGAAKFTETGRPPDRVRGRRPDMPRGAEESMKKETSE